MRAASRSRSSGSSTGPSASSTAISGTPKRKTEPHQKWRRRTPATTGASTPPSAKLAVQTPNAVVRWRGSVNMPRIRASVDGISVAPVMPSRTRAAISMAGLVAKAASSEAAPNPAAPISSRRRRPTRSPSAPIVIRQPATRNA